MIKHTPGPWRWQFNASCRQLHLVGGKPQFDLTVMDFDRWGMHGATMRLRDTTHNGLQLLYRVHERPDWIVPETGREHHKSWHQLLTHPDARLIAAAPDLLYWLQWVMENCDDTPEWNFGTDAASGIRQVIAKATGEQP